MQIILQYLFFSRIGYKYIDDVLFYRPSITMSKYDDALNRVLQAEQFQIAKRVALEEEKEKQHYDSELAPLLETATDVTPAEIPMAYPKAKKCLPTCTLI